MNQPTSRLDMLRFARRVVEQQPARQLALIDRCIADEERRERERRQGEERRPTEPELLIRYGLNRSNVDAVHVGGCWAATNGGRCRPATRHQALTHCAVRYRPCPHCRPDTALGILD
ncbi:DUF6233 domain-containing protein [Streptomyces sp. NPDC020192]|uniref:DUF6233 domain-containing protein n=1 Tax=Streptomyces sp. NPDC020192 TaxID=3365066 RepID=UPI0037BC2F3E